MNGRAFLLALAIVSSCSISVRGQVVQLPTFEQFSISTTVMVPDSGGMSIGGLRSARESELSYGLGPLRNRARGRELASTGVGVRARITDLREMDAEILRLGGSSVSAEELATIEKASRVTSGIERGSGKGPLSVAELRWERARQEEAAHQQALVEMRQGDHFREQGKLEVAKSLYRRAWKRSSDQDLRRDLRERMAQLQKNGRAE